MARERGTFNFSASLEIKKEGALDARQVVQTKAELIQASTWLDDDDKIWLYNGLLVCVVADTDINNGVYFLKDKDNYTVSSNWIKISSISGSTPDELLEAINNALEEAKAYTDDKAGTVTFTGSNYITGSSDLTEAVVELDDLLKNVRDTYLPLSGGKMTGIIRIPYNGLQTSGNASNSLIFYNETELWYGSLPYKAVFDTSNTDMIHRKNGVNHIIYDESNFVAGTDYLAPGAVTIADISDLGSTWDSYLKAGVYNKNITVNGTSYTVMTNVSGATAINIYAPTTAGTSGQFLKSTGGTPSWNSITVADISNLNSTWDTFMTGSNLYTRNILINGNAWTFYSTVGTDTTRIYAPTTMSTNSDQVLTGSSDSIPKWGYPNVVSVRDIRNLDNQNPTPDQVTGGIARFYFTNQSLPSVTGMSQWISKLTVAGWNVGYNVWELAGGSTTALCENLVFRAGINDTWGDWHTIAFQDWTNTQLAKYLPLTGGTLTGALIAPQLSSEAIQVMNLLTVSGTLQVAGNTTLGNVTITGNVTQQGDSFITEAETVQVKDNLLVLNNGEAGAGVTAGISGIEVDRGTATNYEFVFDETDDYFKVGEVGNLQTVLTRDTDANLTNNKFFYWDNTTKQAKTRDVAISDISGLQTDGDGSLYLANDGTYKDVSASSEQEIYTIVPSETANTANASVYTLLKNNSNIVVVYKDNGLFFPISWESTTETTVFGSAVIFKFPTGTVESIDDDWISYDIDLNSEGVCYCTQRSLQDAFAPLRVSSFIYPSDNVTATGWNASLYSIVNPTVGYAVVTETEGYDDNYNKHIGKITKTPDNITIVCTEGNTQITYVITSDGNITKQEADITIDWSDIQSKPSFSTVATSGSYNDLTDKPSIPSAYTLPIASTDILGGIKVGGGLTINSSGVLSATGGGVADSVDIENVAGLNSSWLTLLQSAPSRYVTTDPTWALVTGKPSTFTPSAHTHTATEVTGLAEVATSGDYNDLSNKPAATTLSSLGVTATAAELNYVDGVTSSIQTQLNGKAASNHTHAMSSITDRGTITFTGAISGTYDGTNNISVNIPTAGGGVADSVDWSNVTNKPKWIGDTKPSYNYSEITGTIPIADIPTGTTGSTVALGNHTHSQYLTSIPSEYITQTELNSTLADYATTDDIPSLSGYATQSWVNSLGFIKSEYALPIATADTLGGIRVGAGLVINGSGVLSVTGGGTADAVDLDNITGMNSTWKTLLASAPTRYVTADPTWEQVTGKPTFATVATSGSYDDLTNKPTIPSLSGYATQTWVNGLIDAITPASIGAAASSHSHVFSDITFNNTGTSTQYLAGDGNFYTVGWNEIDSKPSSFTPSAHTHSASDITSGTLALARIPTGTTSSTVALGNHTHSNYLTSSSLNGYATQSWVQSQGYITTSYTLPTASASTLGGIKVGAGLSISAAGVLSATGGGVADAVDWENITSKPDWIDSPTKPTYTWAEINGKPSSFTPSSHTHSASDITSGTLALARIPTGTSSSTVALGDHTHSNYVPTSRTVNGKALSANISLTASDVEAAAITHTHSASDIISGTLSISRIPTGTSSSTVALGNHTHSNYATTTEVNNLTYTDVGAASASHTHGTDDITTLTGYTEGTSTSTLTSSMTLNAALASLQNQVQSKANSSHTHTISQITNMGTLTFTGAATGSYDGSGNLTINIPESSSVDTSNFVTLNGTQTITGTKTFTQYTVFSAGAGTSSDERLKSNIRPIDNPFDILNGLHGHKYVLKSNNEEKLGLIAQEVEKVLPEAVITDETGYKSVDTYPIVAVLVEIIKELKKEIEELKSKL